MSTLQRKLQVRIDGLLLAALGALVLIACAAPLSPQAVIISEGNRFAPATLSGRVGERIVWQNHSPDRHSIVVEPAATGGQPAASSIGAEERRSGDLYHNQQWSHSFEQPGAYRFVCTIHADEDMVGVIDITE